MEREKAASDRVDELQAMLTQIKDDKLKEAEDFEMRQAEAMEASRQSMRLVKEKSSEEMGAKMVEMVEQHNSKLLVLNLQAEEKQSEH